MSPLEVSQKFFDEIASDWDNDHNSQKLNRLSSIFSDLIPEINGPVLDVGCGTGIMVPVLKFQMGLDSHIVELDVSPNMIRRSQEKHGNNPNIHFSIGDAHFLPFRDGMFRSVICLAVFPHFYDQMIALTELKRNLQPGGMLVILHLMGHKELNEMHRKAGRAVERHALQPVNIVAKQVRSLGFKVIKKMEQSDLYLIVAIKPVSS